MSSFFKIARLCFADGAPEPKAVLKTGSDADSKKAPEASAEPKVYHLTPILDKTQLSSMGEADLSIPESFFKDLKVETDEDKELIVAGIEDLSALWKICAAACRRKEWIINKVDIELYSKILGDMKAREKENIYILFTIADDHGHNYVFLMVNPIFIEGRFTYKVQEQTYGETYDVTNTSVISVKYEEDNNPGDYDLDPIIEEFAKEDKTITEEAQSIIENAENEESSEDEWGDEEFEEDVFAEEESGEESEEPAEEEAEPKNFSYFRAFFE